MAPASRASEVPPTTAQVAAAVSATEAAGERRTAREAASPRAAAPPAHTAVCSAPHPRWSRHSTRSTAPAARPNAATGCPRRGSPRRRSPRRPAAAPYAKTRSARTAQPAVGRGRRRRRVSLVSLERQPRMAIGPHSGCPRPGSKSTAVRVPGSRGSLPGHSGGTAPDSHRASSPAAALAPAVHHAPRTPVNLPLTCEGGSVRRPTHGRRARARGSSAGWAKGRGRRTDPRSVRRPRTTTCAAPVRRLGDDQIDAVRHRRRAGREARVRAGDREAGGAALGGGPLPGGRGRRCRG